MVTRKYKGSLRSNKGPYSQSCFFSSSHVWMWELDYKEGWGSKNCCFWPVVLEKTVEMDCKEIKQSILKEINPEYSLAGLMLKLKLLYFGHLITKGWLSRKRPWCWERLKAGGKGDKTNRGWDGWMDSLIQWKWVWSSSRRWWRTGKPAVLTKSWT